MIDYQPLYKVLLDAKADAWVDMLPSQLAQAFDLSANGNAAAWLDTIEQLLNVLPSTISLNANQVKAGEGSDLDELSRAMLLEQLK
ncbi:MAG: tRNA 5-methoxyuridine(34)/uridine 5-oxyacetic acid(34) synthase CmoB, partial [Methylomarinum sp.]|nr:tRNA 5-methoxyuridine(34)/uridine 5-oxyacetic acid(34) synthase CmoB [Methylomarinum sp.]